MTTDKSLSHNKESDLEIGHDKSERSLFACLTFLAIAVIVGILSECLNFDTEDRWASLLHKSNASIATGKCYSSPTYAIYLRSDDDSHLIHVKRVLERLGYCRVGLDEEWNLLWAHDYPFSADGLSKQMKQLDGHQKVNHMPGCGFITNKVDLSTSNLPHMPRAFRLSDQAEFLRYATKDMLFVEKHNEHRHIRIRQPNEVNFNSTNTFVQEFIRNPFLVDGYKFDIGVYVVITSIDPLRVYMYTGDVLFRYCSKKYYPFDVNDVDKYVVGDDYLPTWEIPSLREYYQTYSGSMRGSFDAYLRQQAIDPYHIWSQVITIIQETIIAKEHDISHILQSYKMVHNFFDLLRFDLVIDDQLKVWLMEANMSPNLSSAHFKPNALLYEQILYSVFNLVGIGSPLDHQHIPVDRSTDIEEMITSEKNLAVDLNLCAANKCEVNCNLKICDLCLPCLSGRQFHLLKEAYMENLHKTDMKRILPKPNMVAPKACQDIDKDVNMTASNKWLSRWFCHKCRDEQMWCI